MPQNVHMTVFVIVLRTQINASNESPPVRLDVTADLCVSHNGRHTHTHTQTDSRSGFVATSPSGQRMMTALGVGEDANQQDLE